MIMLISRPSNVRLVPALVTLTACASQQRAAQPVPDAASARPSGIVVASNMREDSASLIRASDGQVLAKIATGRGPHEVAISHDGRWALVTNYGAGREPGSSISVIDVQQRKVARVIDLGSYRRPHGIAFLPSDTAFLVTAEANRAVLVVNFATGAVTRVLQTNGRGSHMLALSRDGTRLVVSNIPDATISVFNLRTDTAASTIAVARQPEGIAITPDGRYAWVGSNADSIVTVVDLTSQRAVDSLRGFGLPYRIAISPDGQRAVITDPAKAIVRIVDVPSRRELSTITFSRDSVLPTAEIPGSPSPEGVAISADSRWAFVTLQGRNRVAFVDLERRVVVGLARTGEWSDGVAHSSITP